MLFRSDRTAFLAILAHVCERYGWVCHSYCLMTNHYHLLIETHAATLARGMLENGVRVHISWYTRSVGVQKAHSDPIFYTPARSTYF